MADETLHWHISQKVTKKQLAVSSGFDGELIEREIVGEMTKSTNPRRTAEITTALLVRMSIDVAGRRNNFRDMVLYRLEKLARVGVISQSKDHLGRSCWASL